MRRSVLLGFLLPLALACGDDEGNLPDGGQDAGLDASFMDVSPGDDAAAETLTELETTMPSAEPIGGFDACTVTTGRHVTGRAGHLAPCEPLVYGLSTPASGDHYSRWADFRRYEAPVPQGFLVHAMEHGAIVFQLGCGDECGTLLDTIDRLIADHGDDPACGEGARFIIAPNDELEEAAFAITAWENVYLGTCVDESSMAAFIEAHYAQGPEDLCAAGFDGEARGWCE